mgnify:CR=1 FL=1
MSPSARKRSSTTKPKTGTISPLRKFLWALLGVLLLSMAVVAYELYQRVYKSNVSQQLAEELTYLHIPTNATFTTVLELIQTANLLQNLASFEWVAQQLKYPEAVKPGRYRIEKGMSNFELVRLLVSGRQEPVKLVINRFRSRTDFYGAIGRRLEADSAEIAGIFSDDVYLRAFGFKPEDAMAVIIPNTYELYWNTNAREFFERMYKEYTTFWTDERQTKATALGLSQIEVMKLASIVDEETNKDDEKGVIARVYWNRLQLGMMLQADPTVRFAHNDFSIKRVTGKHLRLESPYNTYQVNGLPPGPICTPSQASIDAVLNSQPHKYLYFCAKEDFSGYHNFAITYPEHQKNARLYQQALSKLNIN